MKKKILISFILVLMILCNLKVYATSETAGELPSKYDLRNDISIKVENQKDKPWCTKYTHAKAVETYLQKTKGLNYNLSEGYIEYNYKYNSSNLTDNYVQEKDFPNINYSDTPENKNLFDKATEKAVAKNVHFRGVKSNEEAKEYITKYGSIRLVITCDKQMDYYKGGIYHSNKDSANGESSRGWHDVTIIGWDDNYSKDNFVYEKPQNNGAWLVLNSWGTSWGNKGTAWVSYEDDIENMMYISEVTLPNGEILETKLTKDEEQKETVEVDKSPIRVEGKKQNKQNIFEIFYIVIFVLFIVLIIIKIIRHKKKSIKGE